MVADTLRWKIVSMGSLGLLGMSKQTLAKDIQTIESKFMSLVISEKGGVLVINEVRPTFIEEIKSQKFENEFE